MQLCTFVVISILYIIFEFVIKTKSASRTTLKLLFSMLTMQENGNTVVGDFFLFSFFFFLFLVVQEEKKRKSRGSQVKIRFVRLFGLSVWMIYL